MISRPGYTGAGWATAVGAPRPQDTEPGLQRLPFLRHLHQGILYNYATDALLDHGLDVEEIRPDLPVVVWYATDDEDCPPAHGAWLASGAHFTQCTTRVFRGYGHVGAAFIDHPTFLEALMGRAPEGG